ncbi:MAG: hypothetical protein CBD16_08175 [Betaproteobacteria bacterium TMED156]|nr:MAG: hypothetical protein CBD16_08175 [Betaproteobacteria bacterium TMED156]
MKQKGNESHRAWLVKAIETQVIPRLMLAHKTEKEKTQSHYVEKKEKHIFSKEAIESFTQVLIKNEAEISKAYVEALIDEGVDLEDIYLELFQPSARLLGQSWEEDTEDFSAITLALWKMQHTMYHFSDSFLSDNHIAERKGSIFLCPYPESQHTMGLFMVSEFFRKDNWSVTAEPSISNEDLKNRITENFFDILGVSIGSLTHVEGLSTLIKSLRRTSKNPKIMIMIGGPMALITPNLANNVGADAQSNNAKDAILKATDFLERLKVVKNEKKTKTKNIKN